MPERHFGFCNPLFISKLQGGFRRIRGVEATLWNIVFPTTVGPAA
jgi:hypothetical protein